MIVLADKIKHQGSAIQTEEATKTAFIMQFIYSVSGYDVFNPEEVTPEYVCNVGAKKGEKIDYAILRDGEVQILLECKNGWTAEPESCWPVFSLFPRYECPNCSAD